MDTKKCCTCKELKTVDHYSKNKASKDGLKEYCKECAAKKGRKYRADHADEINQRNRDWYHKSKCKAKIRTKVELERSVKTCTSCGKILPVSSFYKRGNGGFYARCKNCEQAAQKIFNTLNEEKVKERRKLYNLKRKELIDDYNHHYYQRKSHEVKTRVKEWIKHNPEKAREIGVRGTQRRNAKIKKLPIKFTKQDWDNCKKFFSDVNGVVLCAYCGKSLKRATQEHVIAVDNGGGYTKDNIIPVCQSCNSKKGNKLFELWYIQQPFYSKEREEKISTYLKSI